MVGEIRTILITGATGKQGSALAKRLRAEGKRVLAYTRDPNSRAAKALSDLGVELVVGDMEDTSTLGRAMAEADGVFVVLPPTWTPDAESDAYEVRLGRNVVDAAKASGVKFLIYSSVAAADHFARIRPGHKFEIEQYVWASGLPALVLRPVAFMENFLDPQIGVGSGVFYEPTLPNVRINLISVEDIAAFAAFGFAAPDRFVNMTLEIAGDILFPHEIAELISAETGSKIEFVHVTSEALRAQNSILGDMYDFLNSDVYAGPNIDEARVSHGGLLDLRTWLRLGAADKIKAMLP